ncbi:uncharacterized protein LOC123537052 isoform X2 [Mercenaria mercenaria]|uniref:uncharacterized protein LOC123537052 isoform X2 n=1 Tax=Mercenaria mercenaria TaxID=6596 RepID=UPI00234E3EDD|nr:uncharacterized protein LOC123537052 isoform X2 [Mercenaria mercenaria]
MDGRKYSKRRSDENIRTADLEEFNAMRVQITDMVSNKFFNHGIITPEDRELLRKLLREIKDITQDIESLPDRSFDIVSRRNLTQRKVHTRDKVRNVMHAFDNNKSIASVLKEEGPHRRSAFLSSDSLETDDVIGQGTDNVNKKFKINDGYENDITPGEYGGKAGKNSTNDKSIEKEEIEPTESKDISATPVDKSKTSNPTADYDRHHGGFYGATGYFLDDYEVTSTISVVSDDNWTLRKSVSLDNAAYDDNEHENTPKEQFRNPEHCDVNKPFDENGSGTENNYTLNSDTNEIKHDDDNDGNLYDDTVAVVAASVKDRCSDNDVSEALGDFDYLDEYHSQSNSSNVSLCGSDVSITSVGKEEAINDYNEKVGKRVTDKPVNDMLEDMPTVKDVLGGFDYLNEYHSRTNSTSTASLYGSEDKLDLDDNDTAINELDHKTNNSVINDYENMLERKREEVGDIRDETKGDYINVTRRLSSDEQVHLKRNNRVQTYSIDPATKNTLEHLNQFQRYEDKSYRHMSYDTEDIEEQSVPDEKFNRHMAYGIEDTEMRPVPDINTMYTYDKVTDTNERNKILVGRARSEETVPSFTHGEFILRRTQSEEIQNQKGAFRQKANRGRKQFDICGFLLKVVLFILFGIGVTEIILGIILRKACNVDEIVPICTITSGGVSICYCIIYIGINIYRKRIGKISTSFRTLLFFIWLILLGLLIAGGVLLYPSIKDYAFRDCQGEQDCCRRKLILITFGAIILDIICQICLTIGMCCV